MTLAPGTTLGRYQILEPLGSGGMATVYKAYEPSLDRTVALKVIRQGFAEDADFAARFRTEAQSVAKLDHPNIVHVHAFDESEGRLFLAMQYLEGGTLKDRIEALEPGTLLPPAEVALIVAQVADALTYAHGLGIVHRDIKPSNIMLTTRGRAVVTDFGIAKIVSGVALTQTGVGIGTPEYMSPEQGAGSQVDARADVYSLGVVAYELLTGRVPYLADTPFAIVAAHMRDPLPLPSSINPALPAPAERTLLKALAKAPAQRFASATEFAAALANGLRGAPTVATMATIARPRLKPQTRSFTFSLPALPRSRPALAAIGVAALVVIGSTGAAISGAFGRAQTTTASPTPSTSAAPTPAAASSALSALKGPLVWQAKLDGTDIDLRGASSPFIGGDASSANVRTVPGAIEFVQIKAPGGRNILLNSPVRDTFVLEVDVDPRAAGQFGVGWWSTGRDPQYTLNIDTNQGRMELQYYASGVTTQPLSASTPAPEVVSGKPFTAALAVARDRFTAFANQRQVVGASPDARIPPAAVPLRVYFGGDPGTLRITGLRLYELAATGAASPTPSAIASAAGSAAAGPPKFAIPAKGALIADMPLNATLFRSTNQGPALNRGEIRYVAGAVEFSAAQPQSQISGDISRLIPDGDRQIVELDLALTPGSDVNLAYVIRQYPFQSDLQKTYGSFALLVGVNSFNEVVGVTTTPPERIDPRGNQVGIADMQKGRAFTIAIVVEHPRYTLFVDQKQVATYTTNGDLGSGSRATLSLNGGPGAIKLTGLRFYALP